MSTQSRKPRQRLSWHGSSHQAAELFAAVAENCVCNVTPECGSHSLLHEQRNLDGLLFARYMSARLMAEEFGWSLDRFSTQVIAAPHGGPEAPTTQLTSGV